MTRLERVYVDLAVVVAVHDSPVYRSLASKSQSIQESEEYLASTLVGYSNTHGIE